MTLAHLSGPYQPASLVCCTGCFLLLALVPALPPALPLVALVACTQLARRAGSELLRAGSEGLQKRILTFLPSVCTCEHHAVRSSSGSALHCAHACKREPSPLRRRTWVRTLRNVMVCCILLRSMVSFVVWDVFSDSKKLNYDLMGRFAEKYP